ncbi:Tm-1-like ATP-binding domain-containing protein [Roseiconus nitratireducens]|uniref:Tm-1-like ATP-binding domain-containing protein n=1 Tax=Roseiconus nitratireducens TaxID=2605748 RepID=UPI001F385751|nr:Tm-1-like ATP-binding domain-containing protein [Roseiconus nitratireducens]
MSQGRVYAIATMDTKGEEIDFVADCLRSAGVDVVTVDVGTLQPPSTVPDVPREQVLAVDGNLVPGRQSPSDDQPGDRPAPVGGSDRGQAISAMAEALARFLSREFSAERVSGVLGIGGSGGTALITQAMRALPIGLPKLMVSTVASGNTAPYVDCTDLTMMFSVVDVAGINTVSERVLSNAAHALAGMVTHSTARRRSRPALGMTMFGVTTPCVTEVRRQLDAEGFDCLVFHATGTGGRAMEKLVESGLIGGVLDITTTEVADQVVGGVFPAGPDRFDRLIERQIPLVVSLGAVDMVNFGSRDTVPSQFRDRTLHVHNAQVTLMRTTADENRQIARWIAGKLNRSTAPVTVLVPEGGVSTLDAPGEPFYDPQADRALFDELESCLVSGDDRRLVRLPQHINDPAFATALADEFLRLHSS